MGDELCLQMLPKQQSGLKRVIELEEEEKDLRAIRRIDGPQILSEPLSSADGSWPNSDTPEQEGSQFWVFHPHSWPTAQHYEGSCGSVLNATLAYHSDVHRSLMKRGLKNESFMKKALWKSLAVNFRLSPWPFLLS